MKTINKIIIISDSFSGEYIIPRENQPVIVASGDPWKRRIFLSAIVCALYGKDSENIGSVEYSEVQFSNGETYRYAKGDENPAIIFSMSDLEFTEKILGSDSPVDTIKSYEQHFDDIRKITGLKLCEKMGVILADIHEKKFPVEVLGTDDIEFIILQIRLYELIKGHIPFMILCRESLSILKDETRAIIFKKILELPNAYQLFFLCDPGDTVGVPWDGIHCPKIVDLDNNIGDLRRL